MPIVSGGIGTTGLIWNSGFGFDPAGGPAKAQMIGGKMVDLAPTPTDPGGTKNWQPPKPNYSGSVGIGGPQYGSSGFGAKWSYGGKNPFATDAAAAKLRDEFARLRRTGKGAMNEDLASRGIFSSGVGGRLQSEQDTQYGLAEGAALEDLYNRSAQQELGFSLEQQRMAAEDARQRAMMGSQRYGSANEMQEMLDLFGQQGGGMGGGAQRFGGSGGMSGGMQPSTGGVGSGDPRGKGSLELARAYYKATGKYGTAADHRAWADKTFGVQGGMVDVSRLIM